LKAGRDELLLEAFWPEELWVENWDPKPTPRATELAQRWSQPPGMHQVFEEFLERAKGKFFPKRYTWRTLCALGSVVAYHALTGSGPRVAIVPPRVYPGLLTRYGYLVLKVLDWRQSYRDLAYECNRYAGAHHRLRNLARWGMDTTELLSRLREQGLTEELQGEIWETYRSWASWHAGDGSKSRTGNGLAS
jgi:hypothetical protein